MEETLEEAKNLLICAEENDLDNYFMQEAIKEAKLSLNEGGAPIGSILVSEGKIIGRGRNQFIQMNSIIRHAEINCIENGAQKITKLDGESSYHRLFSKATIYATLTPCEMCSGSIIYFRIKRMVIGENRNFPNNRAYEKLFKEAGVKYKVLDNTECFNLFSEYLTNNKEIYSKYSRLGEKKE